MGETIIGASPMPHPGLYTPRPWAFDNAGDNYTHPVIHKGTHLIATVPEGFHCPWSETKANAQLMTRSPETFEALCFARDVIADQIVGRRRDLAKVIAWLDERIADAADPSRLETGPERIKL
jgi:hypothetical protein